MKRKVLLLLGPIFLMITCFAFAVQEKTSFYFSSSSSLAQYECSINGSSYNKCKSPVAYELRNGNNTILVRIKIKTSKSSEETKEKLPEGPVEEVGLSKINCINIPSECGYPDSTNSGVPKGTILSSHPEETVNIPNTTIKNYKISNSIYINADDTTIEDSEINAESGSGNYGIFIPENITGTVIKDDTCKGNGSGTQYCIINHNSTTKILNSYLYNCGECLNGPGTIENSFFDVTAKISGEHYEDIYYGGGEGPLITNHNTLLNPEGQTAVVFASTDFGNQTILDITNNLLAGGGYTIYGGGSCTTGGCGKVVGPIIITGNRFSNKYYKDSGYYGIDAYMVPSATKWSDNIWDGTLKQVEEE